ncbi:MAG TPA: class I SAM-dependent methyltransferase [Gemmatimonadaceae bacterium]|nr:class I SAM-dependent methyltransferase [Gemmatimonadaceae bacterium]
MPDVLVGRLACPACRLALEPVAGGLACATCGARYATRHGVIDARPLARAAVQGDAEAWDAHWAPETQRSLAQRFFSVYRRVVFARTVRHFVTRYLPSRGVLLEAGSGTAETSIRLAPRRAGRLLVALDLVPAILERCAPVVDVRVAGDAFRLPFADGAVDGIWNVGVMEHFTHPQIDRMLEEFHRVLRPGGRVVLLWPGTDAVPQHLLDALAWMINRRRGRGPPFRFHPPEISRLRSVRQGREVLRRNGFTPVAADPGWYSGMAFKTIVGEKPTRAPGDGGAATPRAAGDAWTDR